MYHVSISSDMQSTLPRIGLLNPCGLFDNPVDFMYDKPSSKRRRTSYNYIHKYVHNTNVYIKEVLAWWKERRQDTKNTL